MPSLPLAAQAETLASPRPSSATTNTVLPLMQEWAYDFANNELLTNEDGMPYLVSGNEALKIWLF